MNHKTLSLGFVGGGINSAVGATHFIAARMDARFSVDAGAFSRNPEVNRQTGQRWDVDDARVYGSMDDLMDAEAQRIDAVVVLTPATEHTSPILKALDRGLPVISEKPLVSSSEDGVEIAAALERTNGFLAVTWNYTGYPMVRELRRMIADGRLGQITQVQVEMPQEGFARLGPDGGPLTPQAWRLKDGSVPTVSLDLGAHAYHLVGFLTDQRPLEVVAMQGSHGNFEGLVDNVMCLARYSGGIDCAYWFTKSAIGHRNGLRIRIYGRKGSAEWVQADPETLILHDVHGQRMTRDRAGIDIVVANAPRYNRFKVGHPDGFIEAFANIYYDIADDLAAFRAGKPRASEYAFDVVNAVDVQLGLQAMAESVRTRSWTEVRGR